MSEVVKDGGRYCACCGEFLGMTCDPFGRSECALRCFRDMPAASLEEPAKTARQSQGGEQEGKGR